MIQGRGSDSLRAVLLGARTASGSGSKPGSSAVTWHSLRSGVRDKDPPGHYFPAKLAMSTGLIKIFFSTLMVGLGGLALVMKAPLSSLGSGIWVGIVVGVSGFLGVCAARRPYAQVYVISFMSVSILSMAASGLLVVLSATSWARGSQSPEIVLYDKETQSEIDLFGEVLLSNPSILVSGFLVVLGVLDILTSLACVALSAREACGSNSTNMGVFTVHEGHDKKERLYKWLGQQKNIFQVGSPTAVKGAAPTKFAPLTTSEDSSARRKSSSPLTQSTEPLLRPVLVNSKRSEPLSSSNSSGTPKRYKKDSKTSQSSSENKHSSVLFIQPETSPSGKSKNRKKSSTGLYSLPPMVEPSYYVSRPGPQPPPTYTYGPLYQHRQNVTNVLPSNYNSLPCPQHPFVQQPLYYIPHMAPYADIKGPELITRVAAGDTRKVSHLYNQAIARDTEKRKKRKDKRKRREERERNRNKPLTDEQIENSYTGLDREIAEGFINLTMEPSASHRKGAFSDHESF